MDFLMVRLRNWRHERRLGRRVFNSLGMRPRFGHPESLADKIQWRKLYERRPEFQVFCDKYKTRSYMRERLGPERADALLPRLLCVTDAPETLPFDRFGDGVAVKATRGSGRNLLLRKGQPVDRHEVIETCRSWLNAGPYGYGMYEWGYWGGQSQILVEELLPSGGEDGELYDLKAYVVNDRVHSFFVSSRSPHGSCTGVRFYRRNWEDVEALDFWKMSETGERMYYPLADERPKPAFLEELIEVAEALAQGFGFLRVDFLVNAKRFWLGELTVYPGSGCSTSKPADFKQEIADLWRLPKPILAPGH